MSSCCDDKNFNQKLAFQSEGNAIEFINGIGVIKAQEVVENGKRGYNISYEPFRSATIESSVSQGAIEVGQVANDVLYKYKAVQGSEEISSTVVSPVPSGVSVVEGFNQFSVSGIVRTTPGLGSPYKITVTDALNNTVEKTIGVPVKYRMFYLYSGKDEISSEDIDVSKSGLVDDIKKLVPGDFEYFIPVTPAGTKHIYWLIPMGTAMPVGAEEGPLPVPLDFSHPNIVHENAFGSEVTYRVIRTAEKFGGNAVVPAKIELLYA